MIPVSSKVNAYVTSSIESCFEKTAKEAINILQNQIRYHLTLKLIVLGQIEDFLIKKQQCNKKFK